MQYRTDDVRIREIKELAPPSHVLREFPLSEKAGEDASYETRQAIHRILHGADDRAGRDHGAVLDTRREGGQGIRRAGSRSAKDSSARDLLVVMRVYFEKPRTTVGWKGLINDPNLDGSFSINEGLRVARQLLLDLNEMGVPVGCEFLDMITPQYIADLVAWGAIGARTTESQVHRELASGLSCPVGFKNGTDGNVKIAVDAIRAAQAPHHFLSVTKGGHSAIVSTTRQRGLPHHPARRQASRTTTPRASTRRARTLAEAGIPARVMIDFSHGNSSKNPQKQVEVGRDVARQIGGGDERIVGVMVESHLKAGRQDLVPGQGARLRREHHRRLPRLGGQPQRAGRARGGGAPAPAEGGSRSGIERGDAAPRLGARATVMT